MKFKTINWKQHPDFPETSQGFVGEQELFTIVNISKKEQNFELKSANPKSAAFHHSSSLKRLGEFRTLELAKIEAQIKWEEFTNSLLFVEEVITIEQPVVQS